jgi:RHS repeat-associated protein
MWGQTTWTGIDTPWRYPGQYHDPETGLHYNHHRYYQPHTGRYLSPDPLGLAPAPNPYGYPGNPTAFADPFGLAPCPGAGSTTRGVYDVMAEAFLPEHMYEMPDRIHFQEANRQLYHSMRNDPELMESVESRYPGTFDAVSPGPRGGFLPKAPPGLTWHHHETVHGLLRLVDRFDHNARHGDYHPTGSGGRATWGGGSANR